MKIVKMTPEINKDNKTKTLLENTIVFSRWLLVPMYMGLILVQLCYVYKFAEELVNLFSHVLNINEEEIMLIALTLVDMTMIGNLIIMILIGSYSIFVDEINFIPGLKWLSHIDAGILKVKIGMSLVGLTTIHLLQLFIDIGKYSDREVFMTVFLHIVFIISTLGMVYVDKMIHEIKE